MSHTPPVAPLLRLLRYAGPHRRTVALATACSVLNKVFDLAPPVLIGMAIDVVVERDESLVASFGIEGVMPQLVALTVLTVVIWALESAFEYAFRVIWRNLAQTLQHELRADAWDHLQRLDVAWYEDRSSGGLMAILNDDINQLERFLDGGANDLLQVATTVVVVGIAFYGISPGVFALSFLPVPVVLAGSFAFQRRIQPRYAAVRERVADLNALLSNNLGGIATIKAFGREDHETSRLVEHSHAYRLANREAIRLSSAFSPLIRMVIVVGFTATLLYGGHLVEQGGLAVGAYGVLVFMTQRLLWPLTRLGETFDLYQRAMASTARVLDLLDTRAQQTDGDVALASADIRGDIVLDDVSFAYSNGVEVLHGVSLQIEAGATTAIVGSTGSGKSTLVKLLLRFYDVTGGTLTVDGHDVRDLHRAELRGAIGLVSQDVFLFHGTVAENIGYGALGATHEQIVEAAKAAEAHEFITALPDGYETVVGERGQKLSGGQRQRISIARAVLRDPPILVLDEATSAVDNETEAAIQRSMERISVGRTTVVIAHRLSTVRNAHRIWVLEQGRVVEQGRHDELLDVDGTYARLWRVQTGEKAA